MKKLLFAILALLCTFQSIAQSPGCDPCGPWPRPIPASSVTFLSFTFTLPYRPGCSFTAHVAYVTRTCMGLTEVQILGDPQFETSGVGCDLHCPDVPSLEQTILNQIMLTTGPLLKVEPSPCYYLGNITIPAGASICYGWVPGTNLSVLMPCDTNGCCFSQVTGTPGTPYYNQHVLNSTPCPPAPVIPPTATIVWSCDILGGGFASFSVPFTPDSPTVCQMTCFEGSGAPAAKQSMAGQVDNNNLSVFNLYPNPVSNQLNIDFNYTKANETVTIEIYNAVGQQMLHTVNKTIKGKQTITVNTNALAAGSYTCRFIYGPNTITKHFVK